MKIALMTLWNTTGGPSIHAELVAREWIKMGHKVTVFSNYASDFPHMWNVNGILYPHEVLVREDESFVIRNFTIPSWTSRSQFDVDPLLKADYDILVVENLELLPMRELLEVFPKIRERAKTVLIIHEGRMPRNPYFYRFTWDSVICFDERYFNLFRNVFLGIIHIIPFPCHPLRKGDKAIARRKLGLDMNKKIILVFGFRIEDYVSIVFPLSELNREIPLMLLVVSSNGVGINRLLEASKGRLDIEVRREIPKIERLYDYLHASDALCIHRKSEADAIVLSTTAYLTLGSGCPIVVSDCNYFEDLGDEVIKYSELGELKTVLTDVFKGGPRFRRSRKAAEEFVRRHSAETIAKKYIEHFESLTASQAMTTRIIRRSSGTPIIREVSRF